MALKGRHWIAIWLVVFLAAAGLLVARQTSGLRLARALAEARVTRAHLEGRRADLERRLRLARSRGVLVPRAERLGLRLPSDSEIVLLPTPPEATR
jgi:hypothetical protein